MRTQVMEESSVCDTWTHFPCSWCSVKFIFLFNIVHLLSCYFTHHIFWIGSPKRERKACDNHSWLCHVQCDPHSVLAWWLVGQLFETKSKDSRIDPLSVLTFKLFHLFSWFQDWCLGAVWIANSHNSILSFHNS